ncbi:MAG: hypothetical protein WCK32_03935 [Chlorobiaceae bacterium]
MGQKQSNPQALKIAAYIPFILLAIISALPALFILHELTQPGLRTGDANSILEVFALTILPFGIPILLVLFSSIGVSLFFWRDIYLRIAGLLTLGLFISTFTSNALYLIVMLSFYAVACLLICIIGIRQTVTSARKSENET